MQFKGSQICDKELGGIKKMRRRDMKMKVRVEMQRMMIMKSYL